MDFQTNINDDALGGVAASIRDQLAADPAKRAQFAEFALTQVIDWMAGRSTYQSMTEQHTAWLMALLPVFYPDDVPSAERIFNNFSVPYGRAAYISRVLLEKQQTAWRARGRAKLLAALNAKSAEAQQNVDAGDALRYVAISLDNIAYRELTVLLEDIFKDDVALSPPVNKAQSPGRRTVDVPSQLFAVLIEKLG